MRFTSVIDANGHNPSFTERGFRDYSAAPVRPKPTDRWLNRHSHAIDDRALEQRQIGVEELAEDA